VRGKCSRHRAKRSYSGILKASEQRAAATHVVWLSLQKMRSWATTNPPATTAVAVDAATIFAVVATFKPMTMPADA